ncbi:MAG: hypothetical protein KF832_20975 [Caldilineaceae bacterium]|nr:hypothetical protein [Caldilineaceae bacterium]
MSNRPLVRASDIGLWGFCQRAWWLARVRGVAHQRPARLTHGTAVHQQHGNAIRQAHWQITIGRWLLAGGLLTASVLLLLILLQW